MSELSIKLIEYAAVTALFLALAHGCVGAIPEPAHSPAATKQMYQEARYRAVKSLRE